MKITAGLLVKNEDWIISTTIKAALEWVDEIVILDDFSTDKTQEISLELEKENPNRIFYYRILHEEEFWPEMARRQQLWEFSKLRNPDVFVLLDADEILSVPFRSEIRIVLDQHTSPDECLCIPMGCPWNSLDKIRVDPCFWTNCWWSTAIKLGKTELNWAPRKGYDHHQRVPPGIIETKFKNSTSFNVHLQFANLPRRLSKHFWYCVTEYIRWGKTRHESSILSLNEKYGRAFLETKIELDGLPYYYLKETEKNSIDLTSPGWYLDSIKSLVDKYSLETFRGLTINNLTLADYLEKY